MFCVFFCMIFMFPFRLFYFTRNNYNVTVMVLCMQWNLLVKSSVVLCTPRLRYRIIVGERGMNFVKMSWVENEPDTGFSLPWHSMLWTMVSEAVHTPHTSLYIFSSPLPWRDNLTCQSVSEFLKWSHFMHLYFVYQIVSFRYCVNLSSVPNAVFVVSVKIPFLSSYRQVELLVCGGCYFCSLRAMKNRLWIKRAVVARGSWQRHVW